MNLTRSLYFEPGHDCRRFECRWGRADCREGSGGFHGIHGLAIRFVVKGDEGAGQFVLYTGWLPEPDTKSIAPCSPFPVDLGYHSPVPRYDGQSNMGVCNILGTNECYYDGSSLAADEPFRILCNEGGDALWEFLEAYYRHVFQDGEYPTGKPYPYVLRGTLAKVEQKGDGDAHAWTTER